MDGDKFMSTVERTVRKRWKAFKKRWSNLFRRLGSSKTRADTDAGRCHHRPKNGGTSAPARRSDDRQSDDWDSDNGGQGDRGRADSKTFRQRMAALKLKRVSLLYTQSKETNERSMAQLCDANHENFRLNIAARKLEAKLCEATATAKKLEAELLESRAFAREQAAVTNSSIEENHKLNVALSESSRRAKAVERQAEAAERRAEAVERRAKTTGRRAKVAERRAVAIEQRAVATERRARAAERRAELAKRRAEQHVELRPVLTSAVVNLQGLLSSPVADLQIDVLQTAVEKLQRVLEAKTDETVEYDRTDHCVREDL